MFILYCIVVSFLSNSYIHTQDTTPPLHQLIEQTLHNNNSIDTAHYERVLKNTAHCNIPYKNKTPLMWACSWNNPELVKLLLTYGAHVNYKVPLTATTTQNALSCTLTAYTPSHEAAYKIIISLLLKNGLYVNHSFIKNKESLHCLCILADALQTSSTKKQQNIFASIVLFLEHGSYHTNKTFLQTLYTKNHFFNKILLLYGVPYHENLNVHCYLKTIVEKQIYACMSSLHTLTHKTINRFTIPECLPYTFRVAALLRAMYYIDITHNIDEQKIYMAQTLYKKLCPPLLPKTFSYDIKKHLVNALGCPHKAHFYTTVLSL